MRRTWLSSPRLLVILAIAHLFVAGAPQAGVEAAETPSELAANRRLIEEGRRLYQRARFEESIAMLDSALTSGGFSEAERLDAREISGRSHIKNDDLVEGRRLFMLNLCEKNDWKLDPGAPLDEAAVFKEATRDYKTLCQGRPWWRGPFAIVGAVAGAVGAGVLIAGGGGGDDGGNNGGQEPPSGLPMPPDPPTRTGR